MHLFRVPYRAPKRLHVRPYHLTEHIVWKVAQVRLHIFVPLELRACGDGGTLRTGDNTPFQLLGVPHIERADAEAASGIRGDDIGRTAAVCDHAMNSRVRAHLLAKQSYIDEGLDYRVQRVDTLVRVKGCVCSLAMKLELDAVDGQMSGGDQVAGRRVDHDRYV